MACRLLLHVVMETRRQTHHPRSCAEVILNAVKEENQGMLLRKDPMVLSCGGIYLPHGKHAAHRITYHILVTSNEAEPVKVMMGARPRDALHETALKESKN